MYPFVHLFITIIQLVPHLGARANLEMKSDFTDHHYEPLSTGHTKKHINSHRHRHRHTVTHTHTHTHPHSHTQRFHIPPTDISSQFTKLVSFLNLIISITRNFYCKLQNRQYEDKMNSKTGDLVKPKRRVNYNRSQFRNDASFTV